MSCPPHTHTHIPWHPRGTFSPTRFACPRRALCGAEGRRPRLGPAGVGHGGDQRPGPADRAAAALRAHQGERSQGPVRQGPVSPGAGGARLGGPAENVGLARPGNTPRGEPTEASSREEQPGREGRAGQRYLKCGVMCSVRLRVTKYGRRARKHPYCVLGGLTFVGRPCRGR